MAIERFLFFFSSFCITRVYCFYSFRNWYISRNRNSINSQYRSVTTDFAFAHLCVCVTSVTGQTGYGGQLGTRSDLIYSTQRAFETHGNFLHTTCSINYNNGFRPFVFLCTCIYYEMIFSSNLCFFISYSSSCESEICEMTITHEVGLQMQIKCVYCTI